MVCITIIPNILEMVVNIMHNNAAACKCTHFFGHAMIALSCLFIWLIAIDRHRKICYPFGKQFSKRSAKLSSLGITLFALLVATRNIVIYDVVEVRLPTNRDNFTVTGHYCTTREDNSLFVDLHSFFATSDFIIILCVWLTTIISYSHIIFSMVKSRQRCKSYLEKQKHENEINTERKCRSLNDLCENNVIQNPDTSRSTSSIPQRLTRQSEECLQSNSLLRSAEQKTSSVEAFGTCERRMTVMMSIVTAVFIVCFVPFFITRLLMRVVYETGEEYELSVGIQFSLKLVYFNSAVDPIIYFIFSRDLRNFVRRVLVRKVLYSIQRRR